MKIIYILTFLLLSCSSSKKYFGEVSYIDLNKYIGTWHSVKSIEQIFTKKCKGQIATYKIENNMFKIKNECISNGKKIDEINGYAISVNKENTKLEIYFDQFFIKLFRIKGDYNILKINTDYSMALVGSEDRSSLWILSKKLDYKKSELQDMINYAKKLGYDINKLKDDQY